MRAATLSLALLSPLSVSAQEGRGTTLAGGYSYGRVEGESLHGWTASLAFRLGGPLSLVAEATGHYGDLGEGTSFTRLSLFGGPRLGFGAGSARPFVHLLAGVVRSSAGVDAGPVSISVKSTDLGGAAGAGVDFRLSDRWSLRVQGDYLLVRADEETQGDPRASVAAVYRFGGS